MDDYSDLAVPKPAEDYSDLAKPKAADDYADLAVPKAPQEFGKEIEVTPWKLPVLSAPDSVGVLDKIKSVIPSKEAVASAISDFTPFKKEEIYNKEQDRFTTAKELVTAVNQGEGGFVTKAVDTLMSPLSAIAETPGMASSANAFYNIFVQRPVKALQQHVLTPGTEVVLAWRNLQEDKIKLGAMNTKIWAKEKLNIDPTPEELTDLENTQNQVRKSTWVLEGKADPDRVNSSPGQMLERDALSFIGGSGLKLTDTEARNAEIKLAEMVGWGGVDAARFVAQDVVGPAPLLLTPGGALAKTAQAAEGATLWASLKAAAPLLAKQGAKEGLKFGLQSSALTQRPLTEEVAMNVAGGALLGPVIGAASKVAKEATNVATKEVIALMQGNQLPKITDDLMRHITDSLAGNDITSIAKRTAQTQAIAKEALAKADTDFKVFRGKVEKPTLSTLVQEGDNTIGRSVEVYADGRIKIQDIKLENIDQLDRWMETSGTKEGMQYYPQEIMDRLMGVSKKKSTGTVAAQTDEMLAGGKSSFPDARTTPGRVVAKQPDPLSTVDLPKPVEVVPDDRILMAAVDSKGRFTIEPVFAKPDPRTPLVAAKDLKVGDIIETNLGGGKQNMVVHSVNEEGAIVASRLGESDNKAFLINPEQIKLLVNAEEQGALAAAGLRNQLPIEEFVRSVAGDITPQRLMAYYGFSAQRAHKTIAALENRGVLRRVSGSESGNSFGEGYFAPAQRYVGQGNKSISDKGMLVYLGAPKGDQTELGIFRGFNPKNNKYAVQSLDGTTKYLDANEFNNFMPADVSRKDLAALEPIVGINMPMPRGTVKPFDEAQTLKLIEFGRSVAKRTGGNQSVMQKFVDPVVGQFVHAVNTGPSELRANKLMFYGNKGATAQTAADIVSTLQPHFKNVNSPAAQALVNVLEARMTKQAGEAISPADKALVAWANKFPEEAAGAHRLVSDLMLRRKTNSEVIAQRFGGGFEDLEAARALGSEEEYLRGMYRLFSMREDWVKHVKHQLPTVWNDAVKFLSKGEVNPWVVETKLADTLREARTPEQLISGLQANGVLDKQAANALKAKKVLPPELEALLGKETSGIIRLANTVASQESIITNIKAGDWLATTPFWSRGPRPDLPVRIPETPAYGNAAGGYTTKDYAALVDPGPRQEAAGALLRIIQGATSLWKSNNTVWGGPGPWVNNAVRNIKGIVLSGGFDLLSPKESSSAFTKAAQDLIAARSDMSLTGPARHVLEAKQYGFLGRGLAGSEIKGVDARIRDRILRDLANPEGPTSFLEKLSVAKNNIMNAKDLKLEQVRAAYDAIDKVAKLGSFYNLKRKFMAQGLDLHSASALAAERIQQSFPNFELVGPTTDKLRKGYAGFMAPFLSSKIEDMRVNGTATIRLGRSIAGLVSGSKAADVEGDLVARTLGAGLVLSTLYAGVNTMRRMNGVPDDVVEAAKSNIPLSQTGNRPGLLALPELDDKGRVQFVDLTMFDDTLMSLRGNPQAPWIANFAMSNLQDVIGEATPQGRAVQQIAQQAGLPTKPTFEKYTPAADKGLAQALSWIAENGGIPQWPVRAYNTAVRAGYTNPRSLPDTRDKWTPGQLMSREAGLPFAFPVGEGMATQAAMETGREARNLAKDFKIIGKRAAAQQEDATKTEERIKRQSEILQDRLKLYNPKPLPRKK